MEEPRTKQNVFEHAESSDRSVTPITGLLHRIDGLLGVALHRGIDEDWKHAARSTINEIRRLV